MSKTEVNKNAKVKNPAKLILLAVRIAIVYLLVSLFIKPLSFMNVLTTTDELGVSNLALKDVFGNLSYYQTETVNYIGGWGNGLYAAGIVLLVSLVILVIAGLVSICDGPVKKYSVWAMIAGFAASLVGCGLVWYNANGAADAAVPSALYVAIVVYAAALIATVIALFASGSKAMFAKKVDETAIGGKLTAYFANCYAEVKKVVWPSKKQIINNTAVVIAVVFIIGVIIWILDFVMEYLANLIFVG